MNPKLAYISKLRACLKAERAECVRLILSDDVADQGRGRELHEHIVRAGREIEQLRQQYRRRSCLRFVREIKEKLDASPSGLRPADALSSPPGKRRAWRLIEIAFLLTMIVFFAYFFARSIR